MISVFNFLPCIYLPYLKDIEPVHLGNPIKAIYIYIINNIYIYYPNTSNTVTGILVKITHRLQHKLLKLASF